MIKTKIIVSLLSCICVFNCLTTTPSLPKPSLTDKYDEFEKTRFIEMFIHSDANELFVKYGSTPFNPDPNKSIRLYYYNKDNKYTINFGFTSDSFKTIYQIQKVSVSCDGKIKEIYFVAEPIIEKYRYTIFSPIDLDFLKELAISKVVRFKYYYQEEMSQIIELEQYQIEKFKYFVNYLINNTLL